MEALVFTNLVLDGSKFERDAKARTVTVVGEVEGIVQRAMESADVFGKEAPAQRGSIEALEVGSIWSFRDDDGKDIKTVQSGAREWFVLTPVDGPF